MGHYQEHDTVYQRLQQRLDSNITGAPNSPVFMQILRLLYSPMEAEIARQLPSVPTRLDKLSRKLDISEAELDQSLNRLAQRGLVLDLSQGEQRYYALPPVVIGFFEYTFMRVRDDVPLTELAKLFDEYMKDDARFAKTVFNKQTQLGRTLVHEEALPDGDSVEILGWERASQIIQEAPAISVSLCSCRHKASHLDEACERPLETCLSLGMGAEIMLKMNIGRRISASEALGIMQDAKGRGMVQVGDNVKREPTYICNCCSCCCGMIQAIRRFDLRQAIVTSNWIMEVDLEKCRGCAKCVKACPVGAVQLVIEQVNGKRRGHAVRNETLCLGCGVCHAVCVNGGVTFKPRAKRVYTPETMYDRMVAMAIERGKLADLIFEQPEQLGARAIKHIVQVIEHSPPFKAAMAVTPLHSAFMDGIVKAAKGAG